MRDFRELRFEIPQVVNFLFGQKLRDDLFQHLLSPVFVYLRVLEPLLDDEDHLAAEAQKLVQGGARDMFHIVYLALGQG